MDLEFTKMPEGCTAEYNGEKRKLLGMRWLNDLEVTEPELYQKFIEEGTITKGHDYLMLVTTPIDGDEVKLILLRDPYPSSMDTSVNTETISMSVNANTIDTGIKFICNPVLGERTEKEVNVLASTLQRSWQAWLDGSSPPAPFVIPGWPDSETDKED